jgi:hypothetical protein
MKELGLISDWRTLQLFLDEAGVAEVEVDSNNVSQVRCTCSAFSVRKKCAHSKYVKQAMQENEGHYQVLIPEDVDLDNEDIATMDSQQFREFIIKYGKVEVI